MAGPIRRTLRGPGGRPQQKEEKEYAMSALLNIIYREYCRARLAEMRQPALLLPPATAPSDAGRPN
jgi:hypothetical protein